MSANSTSTIISRTAFCFWFIFRPIYIYRNLTHSEYRLKYTRSPIVYRWWHYAGRIMRPLYWVWCAEFPNCIARSTGLCRTYSNDCYNIFELIMLQFQKSHGWKLSTYLSAVSSRKTPVGMMEKPFRYIFAWRQCICDITLLDYIAYWMNNNVKKKQ